MEEKDWTLLTQVYNDVEADIVLALLESNEIPAVKNYKGYKGFMKIVMGTTTGVDIYVPNDKLEAAKALLEADANENMNAEIEEEKEEE